MWVNNQRVFYQKPLHEQSNRNRARGIEVVPGITAHGDPGVFLMGKKVQVFLEEDQARRIAADISDALTTAADLIRPIHTTRSQASGTHSG